MMKNMKQGAFFEEPPKHIELTCANGEPWEGPHPLCEAETDRACERFTEAVKAGTWDEAGYTPNERKARRREHKGASHAEKQQTTPVDRPGRPAPIAR